MFYKITYICPKDDTKKTIFEEFESIEFAEDYAYVLTDKSNRYDIEQELKTKNGFSALKEKNT